MTGTAGRAEGTDLVAVLRNRALTVPGRQAVVYCRWAGGTLLEEAFSYAELDLAARARAVTLLARVSPGDRVLLLYPSGLEFVTSFLGCLYAGVVPVPAPLPARHGHHNRRTTGIAADADVSAVCTDATNVSVVSDWLLQDGFDHLDCVATDLVEPGDPAAWTPPDIRQETLALLQYTSGSTSDPKGVAVSHGNLVHNLRLGWRLVGWTEDTRFCSWLPVYHDMGLIAMLLTPLFLGTTTFLLAPTAFLKRPQRWLELIDRYDAQVSAAPNFAYELCARRVRDDQIAQLDLSRWRYACNGAEPIDPATLHRFAQRFAPAGFRPDSFVPGYGLAETTLFVTGAPPGRPPLVTTVDSEALARNEFRAVPPEAPGTSLVSCGVTGDLEVRIVDPQTAQPLPADAIGEIWIRGHSVAQGYWRQAAATHQAFRAVTADGAGPYLRTGDLGSLHCGELYITGRIKEMIIVHGRNLYPHDLEREVKGLHPAFADLPCSVFSVPTPREEIVVVQEIRARGRSEQELVDLAREVKAALGGRLGVRVANVTFVRLGRICKTSSGKIQRSRMRELFCADALDPVYEDLDAEIHRRYRRGVAELVGAVQGNG